MKRVHIIPSDDIGSNHSICRCPCKPMFKTEFVDGQIENQIVHRYTDGKPYIKAVCAELGIKTPNFRYKRIIEEIPG